MPPVTAPPSRREFKRLDQPATTSNGTAPQREDVGPGPGKADQFEDPKNGGALLPEAKPLQSGLEPALGRVSAPLRPALPAVSAEDLTAWQAANTLRYFGPSGELMDVGPMAKEARPQAAVGGVQVGRLLPTWNTGNEVPPPPSLVAVSKGPSRNLRLTDIIWHRPATFLGGVDARQNLLVVTNQSLGAPAFEALRPSDGSTIWKLPLPTWNGAVSQQSSATVHELPESELRLVTYRTQGRAGVFLLSPDFKVEQLLGEGLQPAAGEVEGVSALSAAPVLAEEDSLVAAARWVAWEAEQPRVDPPNARGPYATRYEYIPEAPVAASADGPAIISYTRPTPNPWAEGGQTLEHRTIALGDGGEVLWQQAGAVAGHTSAGDLVLRSSGEGDYFGRSGQLQIVRPDGEVLFSFKFNGRYEQDSFRELPGGYFWFGTVGSGSGSNAGHLFGPDGAKLYEGAFSSEGSFSENIPYELPAPPAPAPQRPLTAAETFARQVSEAQARLASRE
jgi:hypothetical protein